MRRIHQRTCRYFRLSHIEPIIQQDNSVYCMKIAAFQHTPGEPLGIFDTIFSEKNIPIEYIRLYETNEVPDTHATHLIFLGGPMSVNDEKEYPFLKRRKRGYPARCQERETDTWHLSRCPAYRFSVRSGGVSLCPGNRLVSDPMRTCAGYRFPSSSGSVFCVPAPWGNLRFTAGQ